MLESCETAAFGMVAKHGLSEAQSTGIDSMLESIVRDATVMEARASGASERCPHIDVQKTQ